MEEDKGEEEEEVIVGRREICKGYKKGEEEKEDQRGNINTVVCKVCHRTCFSSRSLDLVGGLLFISLNLSLRFVIAPYFVIFRLPLLSVALGH